jgi:glycosyltransferase involved in cell wall biosynthesis
MPVTVSVIIPTFNCGAYIAGALDSVSRQGIDRVRTIVVDDCSTDNTEAVVKSVGGDVVYFRTTVNSGPAAARNLGIEHSASRYVAFLDADDEWLPGKLHAQIDLLERDPSVIAVGGEMVPFSGRASSRPKQLPRVEIYDFRDMLMKNQLATPTVVVRREALRKVGGFCEMLRISEDYDLWLRLSRLGKVARICYPLARYRARTDGLSAGNVARTYVMHRKYIGELPKRFPDVPGIYRLSRIHLAHIALERAIEQVDCEGKCLAGLVSLAESFWKWPLPLPTARIAMIRLRRLAHTLRRYMSSTILLTLPIAH